jgi:acyl-coenzyme A thioesterase PaaI-like protein
MQLDTHLDIDTSLCGKVTKLEPGYAEVLLHTTQQMSVDGHGLVHGGFIFGAADLAAMSAVNDPYVVLGASTSKFVAPVRVGDAVVCKACVTSEKGKKREVEVQAFVESNLVFEGRFTTFVLDSHVLAD